MGETTNKDVQPALKQSKFKALKTEFKKIIWPSKSNVAKQSVAVIVITTILALLIVGVDFIIKTGLDTILNGG